MNLLKFTDNFIWIEISKQVISNSENNLLLVCCYIHNRTSKYFDPNVFECLTANITNFCDDSTNMILMGGLDYNEFISENMSNIETTNFISLPMRKKCDDVVNTHGKSLLEICLIFNLNILNGRSRGLPFQHYV